MLQPVAQAAGLHAQAQLKRFLGAHRETAGVQQRLLLEMVRSCADTAFGRDHGLAQVASYEQFARRVPVGGYDRLEPYVRRVLGGEFEALLPPGQRPLMFSMTSGSTGQPKYIPVTGRFLADIRRGWNMFGLCMLRSHKELWLRHILQISSPMREQESPTGLPCGAISGLLARTQKRIVRRMYAAGPGVADIADAQDRYYAILRCGLGRDVAFITTANPSSTIKLIETGQRHVERLIRDVADGTCSLPGSSPLPAGMKFRPMRKLARHIERQVQQDGVLLPRHFWRIGMLTNWTGGTLGLYLPRLRSLFDGVSIRDIGLLASEGRFTVPLEDNTPSGVAEILGNFLEFMPDGQDVTEGPLPLAHELEQGRVYKLVVTNWAGLWRYNMDDRVKVTGFVGQSPLLEFLSRGGRTASMTGEKLTEHQVVGAMALASGAVGAKVERFVLQGVFADMPYYRLTVEADDVDGSGAGVSPAFTGGAGVSPAKCPRAVALAEALDRGLCSLNMEYASKRGSGRLGPVVPHVVAPGAMEAMERREIARRRGRGEQYKHQYLLTEVVTDGQGVKA